MNKSWKIPRRTFLKGAGVSILLPLLDIMEADAAVSQSSPRFVAIFNSLLAYGLKIFQCKALGCRRYGSLGAQSQWGLHFAATTRLSPFRVIKTKNFNFKRNGNLDQ